jgi:3-deoxy-manno-octulosonate cytidylyltransferase (CMP-KDO synthetase)
MKTIAVIPARYGSRRFPGKAITNILGRPMIAWVVAAAREARRVDRVIVATDDERIAAAGSDAGAEIRMTRADHVTGTDRVAEAIVGVEAEVILNLQGDEPTLLAGSVDRLVAAFDDPSVEMATLAVKGVGREDRDNPMIVKIVVDEASNALYFSRAPIPFRHEAAGVAALGAEEKEPEAFRHVGTYGFRAKALSRFVQEPRRGLEVLEDLEQLRALRLGLRIHVVEIEDVPVCVDLPEDVPAAESLLRARQGVLG